MDTPTAIALISLILAIFINSILVYAQKNHKLLTRKFGPKALSVHSVIVSIVWGAFIASCLVLGQQSTWRTDSSYPVFGWLAIVFAVIIFFSALHQIGSGALVNANFFEQKQVTKKLAGIYKYVPEPIYVSYSLLLFGVGLQSGAIGFFVLAATSFVGLLIIEAKIEAV